MVPELLGIKTVMFVGFVLLAVLVACGSRPDRSYRRSRDKFLARIANHGMPKGGPYIHDPPPDNANTG